MACNHPLLVWDLDTSEIYNIMLGLLTIGTCIVSYPGFPSHGEESNTKA